jgi:UDP-N-acetylglucosamine 2-epimerase (non-hydrolysing)
MIGLFYGTRPEYIKISPLVKEFKEKGVEHTLFQVQQHRTLLEGCDYDSIIPIFDSGNRLNSITISILLYPLPTNLDRVLVQGDTTTAMAVALNAFNNQIPVIHLEAGLRTYDKENPYPEEVNRRIISSLASTHYCPTVMDANHLKIDGYGSDRVVVTGNTVLDTLRDITPSKGNEVLVTLPRRENQQDLASWFGAIESLAINFPEYSFVFPMHPSPTVQEHKNIFKSVTVCDPIPFDEMKERLAACALTITDSGGIQEECSFFKKVCFVCREVTERPSEGGIMCPTPEKLIEEFTENHKLEVTGDCPFGDGYAATKITEDIL